MRSLLYSGKHGIVSLILFFFLFMAGQVRAQAQPSPGQGYQYPEFSSSMAIIVVILIAAMFFMGFFSVYIRYCTSSVPSNNSVLPLAGRSRRVTARGLDPDVILTFPIFPYSDVKELKIGKGALECAVCLNEFEEDETLRLIPKCDHVFHPECIDEWLSSHTTCPVCRANLTPQPGEPVPQVPELTCASAPPSDDVEAQVNDGNNAETQREEEAQQRQQQEESKNNASGSLSVHVEVPEVININTALNRNRTRGSRSGRPRKFPRSHSTGHSLVQPGENTDRFTLRLPADVRKQIMNRELNRASSFALTSLPREGSSRRGYRGEGSGRGRSPRWLGRSDRWVFSMAPPFFSRTGSLKSPKVAAGDCESSSVRSNGPGNTFNDPSRPPV